MTESPSALLLRAAAMLENRAAHFEEYVDAHVPGISRWESPAESWAYDSTDRLASEPARGWIATMSPVVAAPLVAWLRIVASYVTSGEAIPNDEDYDAALAFARAVLGEAS